MGAYLVAHRAKISIMGAARICLGAAHNYMLDDLIALSPHAAVWPEGAFRVHCSRCRSSFHYKDPCTRAWLASPCNSVGAENDK